MGFLPFSIIVLVVTSFQVNYYYDTRDNVDLPNHLKAAKDMTLLIIAVISILFQVNNISFIESKRRKQLGSAQGILLYPLIMAPLI